MPSRRDMRASGSDSSGSRRSSRVTSRPTNTGPRYRGGPGSRYNPPSSSSSSGSYSSNSYRSSSGSRREYRQQNRSSNNAGCLVVVVLIAVVAGGIFLFNKLNGG